MVLLNFIPLASTQQSSLSISFCRAFLPSGRWTHPPNLVSCAKILRMPSSRSLVKILNRTGPSTHPWGTHVTDCQLDLTPFTTTPWTGYPASSLPSRALPACPGEHCGRQHKRPILPSTLNSINLENEINFILEIQAIAILLFMFTFFSLSSQQEAPDSETSSLTIERSSCFPSNFLTRHFDKLKSFWYSMGGADRWHYSRVFT